MNSTGEKIEANLKNTENQVRVIQAKHGFVAIDFRELWRYRELGWQLAWRSVLIRYKQTYLGIAWAVLQPLLTTVVFTVVFGKLGNFPDKGAAYPVLVFAAMLPWQFFANALSESSNSLIASQNMITKIYFPRIIIPASAVLSGCVDFLISLGLLVFIMLWYHVPLTPCLLLLPLFFLVAFIASMAMGLWFSALNVKYRDVKYVVPFIVRMGFFVSPVGFLSEKAGKWLMTYSTLNPLVGVIDGFRWCILGPKFEPYWPGFWAGFAVVIVLLISGACYFRSTEKTFADVI
jgi:lipopolysaccharide transport system permease protein